MASRVGTAVQRHAARIAMRCDAMNAPLTRA
jgi:hypothetical protein